MAALLTPTSPASARARPLQPTRKQNVSLPADTSTPIITITPASLTLPLTPPLTPGTSPSSAKAIHTPGFPLSPVNPAFVSLPSPTPTQPAPPSFDMPYGSLHEPLRRHLALMHPNTPPHIRSFVAIRLLSRERPYGHTGNWEPVCEDLGDLLTVGVGVDAAKGCKQVGEGRKRDLALERMYQIARDSFGKLEAMSPGVNKY